MAFPDTPLDLRAELQLSGTWTDVSAYLDHGPVTIGRGHPDESVTVSPSTLAMTLTNGDGRFAAKNPTGPYYGSLGRNVPVRISIPAQTTYLRLETDTTSYVSAPDAAGLDITGDTDIRIDLLLSDYQACLLASKYHSGTNKTWALALNGDGTLRFQFRDGGGVVHTITSTAPIPLGRVAIRVTEQVNNGSGGHVTTFYTAPSIGGSWTQLGSAVTGSGTLTLATSTAPVVVGYVSDYALDNPGTGGCLGAVYGFQLRSGIGGTVKAYPDFTSQTAGATSFTDGQGNTWTLAGTAEISGRNYRGHFETADWPQHQDPSGKTATVAVAGGGLLRRLGQRSVPVDSTMKRAILSLSGAFAPVAYWPCEDPSGSQFGSGIGGPAMQIYGTPALAADSSFACSAPLPTVNSSTWYAPVPAYTSNGSIVVRFLLDATSAPASGVQYVQLVTNGSITSLWMYSGGSAGSYGLAGQGPGGLGFDTGAAAFGLTQAWVSIEITNLGGGTTQYALVMLGLGGGNATPAVTATTSGGTTVGNLTGIYVNPAGAAISAGLGHIYAQSEYGQSLASLNNPLNAWLGETAGNRFARLCSEEGVQFRAIGNLAATPAMGQQGLQTLTALLQECADADRGTWTELRQQLGFGYTTLGALCNQAAAVTVSYGSDHLEMWSSDPLEDDQTTVNDVTLTQTSAAAAAGSASYRAYAAPGQPVDGGSLSTLAPPAGAGTYDQSYSVSVALAAQLPDVAGWILHAGTVNEPRYPGIVLDLSNRDLASLFWAILGMDLGQLLVIGSLPVWLPPDPAAVLCQQLTEVLWGNRLEITVTGIPASPYTVAVFDDVTYGRADTDGSDLAGSVTSTATSLSVSTDGPSGILWTTAAGDFPFDINVGGERMTVTNITGAGSPQTFTVTRSVNGVVKAQAADADVRLWFPPVMALT